MSTPLMKFVAVVLSAAALTMTACAEDTKTSKNESAKAETVAKEMHNSEWYEVHHDGRIHIFYDRKTMESFLALKETTFRLTRIGAGPNGATLEFGLTKKDKKKGANTPAAQMWDGKMKPAAAGEFYGEMHKHGRIYIFDNFADMAPVRELGHPAYMYTQIGAGPKGETVVYVLNKSNKKKQPKALIAKFQSMH